MIVGLLATPCLLAVIAGMLWLTTSVERLLLAAPEKPGRAPAEVATPDSVPAAADEPAPR